MVFGISSFTYGWAIGASGFEPAVRMTETDLIGIAKKFDLKCIQLGDNLPVHAFSLERLTSMKNELQKNDIRLEIGARGLTEQSLRRYVQLAVKLASPLIRFVVDDKEYEPHPGDVVRIIEKVLPELEQHHITLGLENHDRFKAEDLAWIVTQCDSDQVGICLDCVNSMGAGEGLHHVVDMLGPYTVNLHVKDFVVRRLVHQQGFTITGAIAGTGMTNVPWLLETISHYGRCQSAVLEQWVEPELTIDDTIKKEKMWADVGIEYLKSEFLKCKTLKSIL